MKVNGDGTYDIKYSDGDKEKGVKEEWVRAVDGSGDSAAASAAASASGGFTEGQAVKGKYRGKKWFDGTIMKVNGDGTYDIKYADGDKERGVKEEWVRAVD